MPEEETKQAVRDALKRGPAEGLTGPQVHSTAPGSYPEIAVALEEMTKNGELGKEITGDASPYPRYYLPERR